jgi:hypothetical protein
MRSWHLSAAIVIAALALGSGIAYATIPDGGGVVTACMLKNVGTVRLIDTALPSSNLLSHCTALETQVSWNQKGQAGAPGTNGADGKSVVMGDAGANCANGGVSLTVGSDTRYVCNGANGQDGQPGTFSGHFQSPNGQYSIDVADTGIALDGPNGMVRVNSAGITLNSGSVLELKSSGNAELKASGGLNLQGSATTTVNGSTVQLNGCGRFLARLGDLVQVNPDSGSGNIIQGSSTVCAG